MIPTKEQTELELLQLAMRLVRHFERQGVAGVLAAGAPRDLGVGAEVGAMKHETYLGDGVYAHLDEWSRVVLTTGHHDPAKADNTIVIELPVLDQFEQWLARVKAVSK